MPIPTVENGLFGSAHLFRDLTSDYWQNPEDSSEWLILSRNWKLDDNGFSIREGDIEYSLKMDGNILYLTQTKDELSTTTKLDLETNIVHSKENDRSTFDESKWAVLILSACQAITLLAAELQQAMATPTETELPSDSLTPAEITKLKLIIARQRPIKGWEYNHRNIFRESDTDIVTITMHESGSISILRRVLNSGPRVSTAMLIFSQNGVLKDNTGITVPTGVTNQLRGKLGPEEAVSIIRQLFAISQKIS